MNKVLNRKYGLDILRVLAMLGVIGLHLIGQGGILSTLDMHTMRGHIFLLIYTVCFFSVNTFAILSGYLSWDKDKVKYKRIIELIFICIFYAIAITLVFQVFNLYDFKNLGLKGIVYGLFPPLYERNWYITCYILLFFAIPYINLLIKNLSKESFKKLLILLFIFFSILPCLFFSVDFFKVFRGYSPFWLIFCYMVGCYLGKYFDKEKVSFKMILTLISCIIAAMVLNHYVRVLDFGIFKDIKSDFWFIDYISPFNVIASSIVVLMFSKIKLKTNSKIITTSIYYLGLCSFSVYISHCHPLVYDYFFNGFMLEYTLGSTLNLVLYFFMYLAVIYLVCFILDLVRILIFKIFRIDKLMDIIGTKMNKCLDIK